MKMEQNLNCFVPNYAHLFSYNNNKCVRTHTQQKKAKLFVIYVMNSDRQKKNAPRKKLYMQNMVFVCNLSTSLSVNANNYFIENAYRHICKRLRHKCKERKRKQNEMHNYAIAALCTHCTLHIHTMHTFQHHLSIIISHRLIYR